MQKLLEIVRDKRQLEAFLAENKELMIKVAAVSLLVVAAFFVFLAGGKEDAEVIVEEPEAAVAEEDAVQKPNGLIYVDIGGEVKSPMVVGLEEGSRVEDAITAAGGVTELADLSQINRAAFVEDGEKIFIPALMEPDGQETGETGVGAASAAYQGYWDDRININTADSEELQELDGIGPATAEKIIDYREENGGFDAIEDIKNVSGIGDKTFEKFKEDIRV